MHSSAELASDAFAVTIAGEDAALADVLPGLTERDRLGIVVASPCGAVGASALLLAAVTAFYDAQRATGEPFFIYPDHFALHVGRPLGDHSMLELWPSHKEVVVPPDPEAILEAVNDRGVTRLLVPDGTPSAPALQRETEASARSRIVTALAYDASGRVADGDVTVAGNAVTESYVAAVLDPDRLLGELAGDEAQARYADVIRRRAGEVDPAVRARIAAAREDLREDGRPVERYRRITLDEALALLPRA